MLEPNRVVVLDVDCVVVEPWGFANALQRKFGITLEQTHGFFSGPFQDCLTGELDLRSELPAHLAEWNWNLSLEEFLNLWMLSDDRPNLEVLDLVSQLRSAGVACHAASNQEQIRAAYLANEMGFAKLFDGLHFSCNIGARKPSTEFFSAVQLALGSSKEDVHFWDDDPRFVRAASQFGWKAFLFEGVESIAAVA